MSAKTLFDTLVVGNAHLRNRFIMAPMTRSRASETGMVSELTTQYYAQRASAGLIISEGIYASNFGKGYVRTPGLTNAKHVEHWKKVTDAVHAKGGKIFAQLMECGRISLPTFLPGNATPISPSAIQAKGQNYTDAGMVPFVQPRELSTSEIWDVIENFRCAALRAKDAGFDGVELHVASGYLAHQFLSAGVNKRSDNYGGSANGRSRFVVEVLEAMCGAIGSDSVGIKISPEMNFNDISESNSQDTYSALVPELSRLKLAYLHGMTGGVTSFDVHALCRNSFKGNYFAGGGFDAERANVFLSEGKADAIVFGNLFISNPDLPARVQKKAEFNKLRPEFFYAGGEQGYTDYPSL